MSDNILDELTKARTAFESTRKALQPLLDAGIDRDGELAPLVAKLERMEAEVARIEDLVVGQAVEVNG
jgi:hypothetical protein